MRIGDSSSFPSVLLNLDDNQSKLGSLVSELSSGLRVQTAADDPSGYAIAAKLQAVSTSLGEGTTSIQNANNLINVAQGGMSQINTILERMHSLFTEANSDINSQADLENIQAEIDQLTQEIDRIASNTQFNGQNLLDGSLTSVDPTLTNTAIIGTPNPTTAEGQALIYGVQTAPTTTPVAVSFTVQSYDPSTNSVTISYSAESSDPGFGPEQTVTYPVASGTNYPLGFPPGTSGQITISGNNSVNYLSFYFSNVTAADVGQTAIITDIPAQDYTPGSGLSVNTGDAEGTTIVANVPCVNSYNLGVAQLSCLDQLNAQASEARVSNAITTITGLEAQLGAQTVSLNIAQSNNETYQTNLEQSASQITDLNIGQATTAYTAAQILNQVGTSILAQMEQSTAQQAALLINALVA
jgi:flagellin